ncbi:MAG: hypothetical protein MZV63_49305 [Marinilabiliales bacterium]|nr:hypothetical protein [Marinilabiliales bacterium]
MSDYARIHLDRRLTSGETSETCGEERWRRLLQGMNAKVELLDLPGESLSPVWSTGWRNIIRHGRWLKTMKQFRTGVTRLHRACSAESPWLTNGPSQPTA